MIGQFRRRIVSDNVAVDAIVPLVTEAASGTVTVSTCQGGINWRPVTFGVQTAVPSAPVVTHITITHDLGRTPISFLLMGDQVSTVGISSTRVREWNSTRAVLTVNNSSTSSLQVYTVLLI